MPTVAASSSGRGLSTTTLTISHTVPAGANRCLVVLCYISGSITLSGTYGGVALTKSSDQLSPTSGGRTVVLELDDPAVGTANVVLTGSVSGTLSASVISVTDCASISTLEFSWGTSTAPSLSSPSAVGELVLGICGTNGTASINFTAGAGQTLIVEQDGLTGLSGRLATSWEPGSSTVTTSWTLSASSLWDVGAVRVAHAAAGAAAGAETYVWGPL